MPHSIEAVTAVLGAILNENHIYDRVASAFIGPSFLYPVLAVFRVAAARIAKTPRLSVGRSASGGDEAEITGVSAYLVVLCRCAISCCCRA